MPTLKKQARQTRGSAIIYISVGDIRPNPIQPRRSFEPDTLSELAESIRNHGIIQPLVVRERNGKYELIAGERRLRAARTAGLEKVPCIVMDINMEESGLLALVENLQRSNLDAVEEAEGISRLLRIFGMSQEEAAKKLGLSQSAIANKLRLLRLPPEVLAMIRSRTLTERQGRALLRLPTADQQREAAAHIAAENLNVESSESYVEALLRGDDNVPRQQKSKLVLKDVRIFMNSVSRSLELIKQGGIDAEMKKSETDSELVLTISIQKKPG